MSNLTGWHKKSESDAEALPGADEVREVEGGGPIFLIIKPDSIGKSNICFVALPSPSSLLPTSPPSSLPVSLRASFSLSLSLALALASSPPSLLHLPISPPIPFPPSLTSSLTLDLNH